MYFKLVYEAKSYRSNHNIFSRITEQLSKKKPSLAERRFVYISRSYIYNLARTPEMGQGLGRILSCGARKPEQT